MTSIDINQYLSRQVSVWPWETPVGHLGDIKSDPVLDASVVSRYFDIQSTILIGTGTRCRVSLLHTSTKTERLR